MPATTITKTTIIMINTATPTATTIATTITTATIIITTTTTAPTTNSTKTTTGITEPDCSLEPAKGCSCCLPSEAGNRGSLREMGLWSNLMRAVAK